MSAGFHPRQRPRPVLSRRSFLARTAGAGLAASGLGSLLSGCGPTAAAAPPGHLRLPAPNHPVTWPISAQNRAVASGLRAERDATLRIFTWKGHVNPACLDAFARQFGCQVQLSAFTDFGQAVAQLQGRHGAYDVLLGAPTYLVGRLVWQGLIQPLNHRYIPNIAHAWPFFANPYYDSGWRYTVPYTVFTTGIAWRKDLLDADPYSLVRGWDFPWVAGRAAGKGKTAILQDYRASIGLALLRDGGLDLNATDPLLIDDAEKSLLDLTALTGLRISNATSRSLASGKTVIHQAWSGQVAAAAHRLPSGVDPGVLGYWFPPDGVGPVGNDTGTVLRGAQNPVLAHLFLNFMLNGHNALVNISKIGYTQPLDLVTPERLVYEGILPASLTGTCVLSTYVDHGLKELQLPVAVDELWIQAWRAVSKKSCLPDFC